MVLTGWGSFCELLWPVIRRGAWGRTVQRAASLAFGEVLSTKHPVYELFTMIFLSPELQLNIGL